MKTIFFLLFIVAIACGVYKCCYKDDDNRKEYIAETGLVYENEYADMDTFVADENYNINEVNVMAIPAENDAVEYKKSGNTESMENSSDIVISDDYFILNVWLNVVSSKIPIKFGKYRVLDSVDFNNNLLTIEFLTDETLFEYLDQEIADDSLQLLFTTKVSKQKVQNDFKALTDEIYSNNIIIKLVFVSDGIPQKKKTYTYSVSKMKKVLEIE